MKIFPSKAFHPVAWENFALLTDCTQDNQKNMEDLMKLYKWIVFSCLFWMNIHAYGLMLKEVIVESNRVNYAPPQKQWTTVFRKVVSGMAGDELAIRASNQVTTEDNELFVLTRIIVDGRPVSAEIPNTGKQPDDIGGNHHFGVYAIGNYQFEGRRNVTVEFQVKLQIIDRKSGQYVIDPPPNSTVPQGQLIVEHYSDSGMYGFSDVFRIALGATGKTFCCNQTNYEPFMTQFVSSIGSGDIFRVASSMVVSHNSQVASRKFDGEQIATAIVNNNSAQSGYIGENVTSRNPYLTVFNEASFLAMQFSEVPIQLYQGANFRRGAFADNALTNIQTVRFSRNSDMSLQENRFEEVQKTQLAANRKVLIRTLMPTQQFSKFLRFSGVFGIFSNARSGGFCRIDIINSVGSSSVYRSIGNGYRYTTIRIEFAEKQPNVDSKTQIYAICSQNAEIISGNTQILFY